MNRDSPVWAILDLARWAPSGDNTQPWRFEVIDDTHFVVHGFDTRAHCVYDLDGRPSQISLGALLETIDIAASAHGCRAEVERRTNLPETRPTFEVSLASDQARQRSPLVDVIVQRAVQRRVLSTRSISDEEKRQLEASVAPRFQVEWFEGPARRWQMAKLMYANAEVRLTMPEAFEVHRSIIEWNAKFSEDKVPDAALGADPMTLRLMRVVMKDWGRVAFFNRYLFGTLAPRIQMDLIPGLACGAHYALVDSQVPRSIDDHVAAGRAVQRFWLTATLLGLNQQPEMTPLIFEAYLRKGVAFTRNEKVQQVASRVAAGLRQTIGVDPERAVWLGRLGAGKAASARSVRMPLEALLIRS